MEKLFKVGLKEYGRLSVDDCYGCAPLPALVGAMIKEYFIKVKIREYVSVLAQTL